MSRSNPNECAVNPASRWFEWNGETGVVRYYDKEAKRTVDVGDQFQFTLLDQLGSVRGWHDASQSGIYSNEVKDTTRDVLLVKAFKGGIIAEGLYRDIKDRAKSAGGQFVANCYIAYKGDGGTLALGSMRFKGSSLGAWMEFTKTHRGDLYTKAIKISGSTEGKKGKIIFKTPNLKLVELSPASNVAAIALDKTLQEYLTAYLSKNKRDQVETTAAHVSDEEVARENGDGGAAPDDDIPFARMGGF